MSTARSPATWIVLIVLIVLIACLPAGVRAESEQPALQAATLSHGLDWGLGGVGGVYFLAEPGELIVEVSKRDRHRTPRRTELRAILFAPDRQVLAEQIIPHDGREPRSGTGPVQSVILSTKVLHRGVYGLNITVGQDRYGEDIAWGFRTNCPRYLVETSRGHRDARHAEPIVLLRPDRSVDVAFLPRRGAFEVKLTDLATGLESVSIHDDRGRQVALIDVQDRAATHRFEADRARGHAPWRLHLAKAQAHIEIEGVTLWDSGDRASNMALWTLDPAAWFPLADFRWLIQPYRHLAYARPGVQGTFTFELHNNSARDQQIDLELEFPGDVWAAQLSPTQTTLAPGARAPVHITYEAPAEGDERVVHLRATPAATADLSTYATLTVRGGEARADRPLEMPVVLRPYVQENAQFGYAPGYPLNNQPYFDAENRPFVGLGNGIACLRDGEWVRVEFSPQNVTIEPPLTSVPLTMVTSKIAFDADNDVYVLASAGAQHALLHSADRGLTFRAYLIEGREGQPRHFDIEQFSGHNPLAGPPPFVRYTRTDTSTPGAKSDRQPVFWRRVNDLDLFVPRKQDGRLILGEPIRLSDMGLGVSMHSGPPASIVSRGSKVHVCWGEATDPDLQVPGVPSYVATYDRETGRLGEPALIGYGPPANDVHNTPSITMDSAGFLHTIVGTHGRPFLYARSLQANDAHGGWTSPVPTSAEARQTYVGLVCGADDTLHLVFRLWHDGEQPFPGSTHARLAYQRKAPGGEWEPPRSLVVAAFSEYSVYHHRLTLDRRGDLFLSYDYWSTFWFYRNDPRVRTRAVLTSDDGGRQWRLW